MRRDKEENGIFLNLRKKKHFPLDAVLGKIFFHDRSCGPKILLNEAYKNQLK